MNTSLNQYVALYDAHAATICSHSAPMLNARRQAARRALEGARLPDARTEGYEKTSLEHMYAPDFGINIERRDIPADVAAAFRCDVPRLQGTPGTALMINDAFNAGTLRPDRLPEGMIVCSLAEASRRYPDLVEPYYGRIAPADSVPVALNTLLAQDGLFVYIPPRTAVPLPLQWINLLSSPVALMAVRRVLVVVGEGASAQLLSCDHTQSADTQFLVSQVVEIALGRDSRLAYYDMEESTLTTSRNSMMYVRQEAGSSLEAGTLTLSNGTTRNDFCVDLAAEGAETTLVGMAIASSQQHVDNATRVAHDSPRCRSRQMFKYILDDRSQGAFEGDITVCHGAVGTEAYQSNRNLLASTDARMHTKPQLLIYCDDVKCSHGATTGQLDQEALFYMRQRGISLPVARRMLMQAFMAEVIDMVGIPPLRDRLHHLVERRLSGQESFCADCSFHKDTASDD